MTTAVVKVGTSSLTDASGQIDEEAIERVAAGVADLRRAGHQVVLVTSGAIAAGLPELGMDATDRPSDAVTLQAASSVGHPVLHRTWAAALSRHDLRSGQILLAPHNFGDRRQYLHARATLSRLLELGVVPVVNENDAVTDEEIRFGDNDRIAALVASLVSAEVLVLLTDTEGVLTADPRIDPSASLIEEIVEFDRQLLDAAGASGSVRGSGGMASKLKAAIRAVIARADRPDVIPAAVAGTAGVGTSVVPRPTKLSARKVWIGFAMPSVATLTVDAGARTALEQGGRSLLAAGVTEASGPFERRDPIEVADPSGEVFAKGIARVGSGELADHVGVVIHVDDMVVLA